MSDPLRQSSSTRPRRWWLAVLLGAAPHLVVLVYFAWPRDVWFTWSEGSEASIPYVVYGRPELIIIPLSILAVLALTARRRSRPWALWLLLGTLAGATSVLLVLAGAASTWQFEYDFGP
ncbi:hypothetical protein [Paractinoplanes maris]|uniref:hypothetical protein n=1 Tax=Paractinoplanes maris TaxID=1734446 RepID=UPI00201FCBAB|nr:hypothetical protein [Actinoplanes maris]